MRAGSTSRRARIASSTALRTPSRGGNGGGWRGEPVVSGRVRRRVTARPRVAGRPPRAHVDDHERAARGRGAKQPAGDGDVVAGEPAHLGVEERGRARPALREPGVQRTPVDGAVAVGDRRESGGVVARGSQVVPGARAVVRRRPRLAPAAVHSRSHDVASPATTRALTASTSSRWAPPHRAEARRRSSSSWKASSSNTMRRASAYPAPPSSVRRYVSLQDARRPYTPPVSARGEPGPSVTELVGRADELARIARARRTGAPGVVIYAEAGAGKTRLARHVVDAAEQAGHMAGWVRATRSTAEIPAAAFASLLAPRAAARGRRSPTAVPRGRRRSSPWRRGPRLRAGARRRAALRGAARRRTHADGRPGARAATAR
jgi:hypothetical protein